MEYTRQPCPIRIVEDCGCGYMIGSVGGAMFQYLKGFRNSPSGLARGLYNGLESVKIRTPGIAGSFALWGATYSTVDCAVSHLRQRDDSWNSIVSGAVTGGIVAARRGIFSMANGAFSGCLLLAMLEGAGAAVATIYADADQTLEPKRPQWEEALESHAPDFGLAEFDRVLDKCRLTFKYPNQTVQNLEPSQSLVEIVKLADVF
ncbi:probable mitochondrial import inner membrane translocase subunit Tim17 3 [Drosophila bipectinata]|uniref:probable mitochondrial import inner membrane translocase subunit Tim17 3 n=1 Tax=Drosophila bipectinata TaxID=42026 RepID=UPI001C8A8C63|nr:probable mitochondrial import inner membrane translocase subunit Tim17 3 [Drosophila bipectinata]